VIKGLKKFKFVVFSVVVAADDDDTKMIFF